MEKRDFRNIFKQRAFWATRDTPLSRIVSNSGWLFSGKLIAALLSFFYLALVTRTLGPQAFGIFIMIVATVQFIASLLSFDSWQAVVKYGQAAVSVGDRSELGSLASLCLAIDVASAVAGILVAGAVLLLLNDLMGLSADDLYAATIYAAVTLLSIRSTAVGLLRLNDKFAAGAMSDTMSSISRMIGASLAALFMPSVEGFLIAWAVSEIVVATTYWIMVYYHCRHRLDRLSIVSAFAAWGKFPSLIRFLFACNFNMTLKALLTQGPILLVGSFVGVTQAGLYRLASQLAGALALIAQMISRSIFSEMARSQGRITATVGHQELYQTLNHTLRIAAIGAAVISLLLIFAGEPFLLLMAGNEFLGAYPMLLLLGFSAVLDFAGVSFIPLLLATDRARIAVWVQMAGIIILAILLAFMLPAYGAQGAASAVLAVGLIQFIALGWIVRTVANKDRQSTL
jgi:O-antigen/teichoic acid export membrane protein